MPTPTSGSHTLDSTSSHFVIKLVEKIDLSKFDDSLLKFVHMHGRQSLSCSLAVMTCMCAERHPVGLEDSIHGLSFEVSTSCLQGIALTGTRHAAHCYSSLNAILSEG